VQFIQHGFEYLLLALPQFCFGYPFVMAWYWMAGGLLFYVTHERHLLPQDLPPDLTAWPPISIIVPCFNEMAHAEETLTTAAASDYPDFEIIAVNDGSSDGTVDVLNALALRIPRLRVAHLEQNQGKAIAMNAGAVLANHEILVCIDGDALLDPQTLRWVARAFLPSNVGGMTGNPRIRNRTTILGRLQVGEFSSIMGLIKRAQTMYGRLFTVSGVICAFRKSVVASVGWWSPRTLTDDVDITWRVQMSGWRVVYEPNAIVWILMPETLIGLWRQRLRWAEGGAQAAIDYFVPLVLGRVAPGMSVIYLDFVLSVTWAYAMVASLLLGLLWTFGLTPHLMERGLALVPEWWGLTLALTYLVQAVVSHLIERRYERNMLRNLFWIIWYPLAFWLLSALTSVVALPRAIFLRRAVRTKWVSPDRGLR
jgi:biofilm PGA synthesis N-glycosyltransferase PgaC